MVREFHSSGSIVNLTLSGFAIGVGLIVLITGDISNYYGRRPSLLSGIALFNLASWLIVFSSSLSIIIGLRVIQALGFAFILIIPRLILKDTMNASEQLKANGVLLIGLMISPAIAPIIGSYLAHYWGWRSCFLFSAILCSVLWLFAYKFLPETNLSRWDKFPSLNNYIKNYRSLLSNPSFIYLNLLYSSGVGVYFAFLGISSYLYIDFWHFTPLAYSHCFIGLSVAYLVGNQVMQWLNKSKYSILALLRIGVISTSIGLLIVISSFIFQSISLQILLCSCGILFMRAANAIINPPAQIQLMNYFHQQSGKALGLNMSISFLLNSIISYAVIILPFNPLVNFIIMAGICVSCAIVSCMYLKFPAS
ncbi:MAG: hypothetical protein RLZZ293_35 [Pseudomonadota bacterium]|jgi:predicted MFS family arabinose efflux permease